MMLFLIWLWMLFGDMIWFVLMVVFVCLSVIWLVFGMIVILIVIVM